MDQWSCYFGWTLESEFRWRWSEMVAGQLHWSCYSESESPTRPDALVSSVMLEASEIVAGQVESVAYFGAAVVLLLLLLEPDAVRNL